MKTDLMFFFSAEGIERAGLVGILGLLPGVDARTSRIKGNSQGSGSCRLVGSEPGFRFREKAESFTTW